MCKGYDDTMYRKGNQNCQYRKKDAQSYQRVMGGGGSR